MLRSKGLRCILFFPCCLASRAVTISDSSQSSDFLLGRSLLFSSVCHPTPHLFPSLCLPVGSILSPLPLPSLCFSPSFLVWPIAPFRFAQGKECRVCIAWQYARSHHFLPIPSFAFYAILPSYLSLLSLIPCFLPLSYLCLNSSSPPRSLHLSPSTSLCPHHSFHLLLITNPPSLSLPAFIHTSLCVFLSSILPLLPPPLILSSAGLRSSEQVLSPFDLGAFGLMLSAQLLKQLPPPDASQFGAGVVTYTQTHTHTHIQTSKHAQMQVCLHTRALTHTQALGLLAHCNTDRANQLLYASLLYNPGVCFCSLSKTSQTVSIKEYMTRYCSDH